MTATMTKRTYIMCPIHVCILTIKTVKIVSDSVKQIPNKNGLSNKKKIQLAIDRLIFHHDK